MKSDSLLTVALLAGGAYLLYQWLQSSVTVTVVGTPANPITIPAPPPNLISSGPLQNLPAGPTDPNGQIPIIGNSGDPLTAPAGVAGYFDRTGQW